MQVSLMGRVKRRFSRGDHLRGFIYVYMYERVIDWSLTARGIVVLISIFQMDS